MMGVGNEIRGRLGRSIALLLVGALIGSLSVSPAGAHIGSVKHLINKHLKKTFFTKAQSNNRFLRTGRGLRLEPNATSPNVIGGHEGNQVAAGVVGATIGGGGNDPNRVTDDFGTIGGGRGNQAGNDDADATDRPDTTVGGGRDNIASGRDATVAGGLDNIAGGLGATVSGGEVNQATGQQSAVGGGRQNLSGDLMTTVGGGFSNTALGAQATIGGGAENFTSGDLATIPGGWGGEAALFGQMAHASGYFEAPGDAQGSQLVLRIETSDGTPTDLFLDGESEPIAIAPGHTLTFEGLVAARSDAGESAGYRIQGVIKNVAGVTSVVGAPTVDTLAEDDGTWDVDLVAADALVIRVTGAAGKDIRWVATVRTAQVAF